MNNLTARAVQGTVQFVFYTLISACILLSPGIIGVLAESVVGA
ncbi:hypothetical protein [Arthrobacter antibioticus]|nr:hypothetical protein [Arthrobacter sp. H35-MC1]MDJ0317864.1 hypothetical protein [Arthrobacter sp. H35-MC1]